MRATASSAGRTPDRAKKQGCITVLMRLPMPSSAAIRVGVDHPELHVPADEQFLDRRGELHQTVVGRDRGC